MGAIIGYALASGNAVAALAAVVVGGIAMAIATYVRRSRAGKEGRVLFDEMHVAVASRSAYTALRASLIAVAVMLIITVWPLYFGISVLPVETAEKLYPGLGLSFAIMTLSYLVAYAYYMRSRTVIEG